jgi:MFS family permease
MLGTLFGGLAMAHFGWRAMFLGLGTITLLWLWPWFAVTRNTVLHAPDGSDSRQVSYLEILQQREFWGVAFGQFLINYAFYFVLTWLPSFLVKAGGFTVSQMAGIGAVIYGIYAVTTALAGAASDRWIQRGSSVTRVRKMFLAQLLTCRTIACCARCLLTTVGSCITAVFFGLSPMIFRCGPRRRSRARALGGAQNPGGQLAGIVSPIVTGLIVDRTGGYSLAFAVAAAAALLSMVAWGVVIRQVAVQWSGESAPLAEAIAHAAR